MSESERITVEEWAGEHSLSVNDEQIEELLNALDVANDAYMEQFRKPVGYKTAEDREIELLKKKIDALDRFISSKGYSIYVGERKITEYQRHSVGTAHWSTHEIDHYY